MAPVPLRLISESWAVYLSVLCTAIYVGVLYLHRLARPTRTITKDNSSVIRARMFLVSVAVMLTTSLTVYIGKAQHVDTVTAASKILALHFSKASVIYALSVTSVLFAGPLFEYFIADGGIFSFPGDLVRGLSSLVGIRNYIAGPLSEELVFRSCIIPLHLFAAVPVGKIILLTPLYFGLAHIHHVYERVTARPDQLKVACVISLVQFGYTTMFGWFASYLFIKTGSVWSCILVHSFCNSLGLPRVTGRVSGPLINSVLYYALLVAGALGAAQMVAWDYDSSSTAYQPYSFE